MWIDLVRTTTADGVRLDGAYAPGQQVSTTAALLLSGVGSNFYGSALIEGLANALGQRQWSTLRINTRGHDQVSMASTDRGGKLQGAALEIVDDCRHDIEAWVQFLVERGHQRVVLIGHSLGALKILYAQAHQPPPAVEQLIAISPPRLSYGRLSVGRQSADFLASHAEAQRLQDERQPEALFLARFPFPIYMSAATYIDKYGPAERYNLLRFVSRIHVPLHFVFGAEELSAENEAFCDLPTELEQLHWPQQRPTVSVIRGANHFYNGRLQELASEIGKYVTPS